MAIFNPLTRGSGRHLALPVKRFLSNKSQTPAVRAGLCVFNKDGISVLRVGIRALP